MRPIPQKGSCDYACPSRCGSAFAIVYPLRLQYKGQRVVTAKQGYSGDIIDWIDSSTLPVPDEIPVPPFPIENFALSAGMELPLSELDRFPELIGPEGTTPQLRPDFSDYRSQSWSRRRDQSL